jgi:hypothetical protein
MRKIEKNEGILLTEKKSLAALKYIVDDLNCTMCHVIKRSEFNAITDRISGLPSKIECDELNENLTSKLEKYSKE